jgi:hypothetical protein
MLDRAVLVCHIDRLPRLLATFLFFSVTFSLNPIVAAWFNIDVSVCLRMLC